jgi:DNA primase
VVSDEDLEKIRSRADIAQVIGERIVLKRAGRNLKGLCPFHQEKTPSFMVHPEKQIFHCFGCGEGGDIFSFLMKYEGLEFMQAVERLADRYGVALSKTAEGMEEYRRGKEEKDLFFRLNRLAAQFFYKTLTQTEIGKKGRDYLEKRGIREEMIREAILGYAPADGKSLMRLLSEKKAPLEQAARLGLVRRGAAGDYFDFFRDRLVFSIVSADGKVLGFSGRSLDDSAQPKYLNSSESAVYHKSDSFLGMQTARAAIREEDQVILVEGNFDLLRLQQEGIRNAVAPLGTALTDRQVRNLARLTRNFVLLFDGDEAGFRAAGRALEIFLPLGISPKTVLLPQGEDPDSFVKKEGGEALRGMISVAPYLLDLRIDHIFKKEGGGADGKARAVREIAQLLLLLPDEIEKRLYIQRVAERVGLPEGLLEGHLFPQKRGRVRKESNFSGGTGDEKGRKLPPIERTVLEVLLSGHAIPELLFQEIEAKDFSHPDLGEVWRVLKEDCGEGGGIDVARILNRLPEGPIRRLVTELTMTGGRWKEEGEKAAADCLRQLRVGRIKTELKRLSQEIRQAETEHDPVRVKALLDEKSRLVREMTRLH